MQIESTKDRYSFSPEKMIDDAKGLVSPPEICFKVFELIDSKHGSAEAMSDVIAQDPNLTIRLLKIVNSAYYSFPSKVETISRAISIIGSIELYNLVVAVQATCSFSKIPVDLINIDSFWQHSLYTGLIAKKLATQCKVLHPERLFVAGLLHDIGSLILFHAEPEMCCELLEEVNGDERLLADKEQETFGFSHADVGGELMKLWNLPMALQEATNFHHQPTLARHARLESCILHLADVLANQTGMGTFAEEAPENVQIDDFVWDILGMKKESFDFDHILGEAGLEFGEMSSMLLVKHSER